jgi:hypothetical protein
MATDVIEALNRRICEGEVSERASTEDAVLSGAVLLGTCRRPLDNIVAREGVVGMLAWLFFTNSCVRLPE